MYNTITDGFRHYLTVVDDAFGSSVGYAMLVKLYSADQETRERYNPSDIVDVRPVPVMGNPKPQFISTSNVERQNPNVRMQMRRSTDLANAFSKKLENLPAVLSLYFACYNFCQIHSSSHTTPAMEAELIDTVRELSGLIVA